MEAIPETTFYIDENCCCHAEPGEGRREMRSDFFTGREGTVAHYRYVPLNEQWTRADGVVFEGEMISPI